MTEPQIIALVVDDSEVVRTFVAKVLESCGCLVFTATNGEEAVRLAAKGFAQLVMMDLYMPLMDGWTAAKEIRKIEGQRGKRRCFMVAMSSAPNRESCLAAGMNDVIEKPVTNDMLHQIVEEVRAAEHSGQGPIVTAAEEAG
jgi:two-component system, sensor histidine kinase and response regulator